MYIIFTATPFVNSFRALLEAVFPSRVGGEKRRKKSKGGSKETRAENLAPANPGNRIDVRRAPEQSHPGWIVIRLRGTSFAAPCAFDPVFRRLATPLAISLSNFTVQRDVTQRLNSLVREQSVATLISRYETKEERISRRW